MQDVLGIVRRQPGPLVRHVAVAVAATVAYFYVEELRIERVVLWVLGSAALGNCLSFLAITSRRAGMARLGRTLSPLLGVVSWGALIGVTGGVESSPFVAGLWLEIVLSALGGPTLGIAAVGALAASALWTQEFFVAGPSLLLTIHTGFLGLMTIVMLLSSKAWGRSRRALSTAVVKKSRLVSKLEERLEEAQTLARAGEETARIGHGMKNAVHSMRGFTQLLDPVNGEGQADPVAVAGLHRAIDQLEALGQQTFGNNGAPTRMTGEQACALVRETAVDIASAFPDVNCELHLAPPSGELCITPVEIRDMTTNLVLNAIEAMEGRGELTLEADGSASWELRVTDRGPGLTREAMEHLFRPGRTTKTNGSGFGLYLSRQLVKARGGRLLASTPTGGGARFTVSLPVMREFS